MKVPPYLKRGDTVGIIAPSRSVDRNAVERFTLLLEKWGLIPESYQYRNFHLVPTLLGTGMLYLLDHKPGPAASRLQSARRSFPKDDLFFREFLFAKCCEQGVHRQYAALLLSDNLRPLLDRVQRTLSRQRK